jgi:hypothetical protein
MAGKSAYLEDSILKWIKNASLTGTAFNGATAPTTEYVALFTTNPTADDGTGAVEVSGGSYARASITASSGWSAISGSGTSPHQISNSGVITFPTPTGNWGAVIGIGLYDASTSGNLLYWSSITSQTINTGVVASLAIGALVVTDD